MPEEEAEGERWRESQQIWFILLQFMLRPKARSGYRYTDQPQHHSCRIWYFDLRYLLQGCFSLIQYSTDRLNLVRAVSLHVPMVRIWLFDMCLRLFHQFVMYDIRVLYYPRVIGKHNKPWGTVMPPVDGLGAHLCTLTYKHITPPWTLRSLGSLPPPDPHRAKLTPWERNHRIRKGGGKRERL